MTVGTCTCSGHANEPNPCPVCELAVWSDEALDDGNLDQELGEWVRKQGRSYRPVCIVVGEFLESRLEAAVPCPEEGP